MLDGSIDKKIIESTHKSFSLLLGLNRSSPKRRALANPPFNTSKPIPQSVQERISIFLASESHVATS